ncbi:MAG: hypothetical protein NC337_07825 [Roseburia sp.]|nr:hypothetical protein [Roseburia sp.]
MKNEDGSLRCSSCGYCISAASSLSSAYTAGSAHPVTAGSPASGGISPAPAGSPASGSASPAPGVYQKSPQQAKPGAYSYDEDHAAAPHKKASGGSLDKYTKWKLIAAVAIVLSTIGILLPDLMNSTNKTPAYDVWKPNTIPAPEGYDEQLEDKKDEIRQASESGQSMALSAVLPESEMWQQFISQVFDKDYLLVGADELAQVVSLKLYDSDYYYQVIEYSLDNGRSGKFFYNNVSSLNTADLRCFPNLEVLDLGREELERTDLNGLWRLRELHCANSPLELAEITDPAQLQSLYLSMNIFSDSLFGIEAFTNLSHLSVDGNWYLTDISPLSALENLTSLEITDGDTIDSFQVLYDMPWLEKLSIDSQKLRDIGFVSGMSGLTELTIQNSEVKKPDALNDCKDTLTKLNLSHNAQITDYAVVSEMTRLSDLTLFISYSFDEPSQLPDFSNMPELKRLSIGNYDNFDGLAAAAGLEELSIRDVYTNDLSAVSGLTKLKRLNLIDMSLDPGAIEPLMSLTNLEVLDMTDSYIWGNVEELLKLPNLKELNLDDCTTGFDVENLTFNESLTSLNMSNTTLKALVNGEWDYNAGDANNFDLSQHTDIFQYYPNLTELYLSETGLDDVAFAADLRHLMFLDITDNYVTDLSPLSGLPDLKAVMCAENPIAKDGGLGNRVLSKN